MGSIFAALANPFGMIIAIVFLVVAVPTIKEMYKLRLQHRAGNQELAEMMERLGEQMEKLEKRMGNLETIVLEREKEHAFDDAL